MRRHVYGWIPNPLEDKIILYHDGILKSDGENYVSPHKRVVHPYVAAGLRRGYVKAISSVMKSEERKSYKMPR